MSTTRKPPHRAKPVDPFFFGWRDVFQTDENGRRLLVQVPLTEEDVLHPQEGEHIVNNDLHTDDCTYLREVFRRMLSAVVGALVLSDVGIYWDDRSLRHHSPDVAVIFGTRRRQRWPSFYVAREGVRPTLILEISSPSTRHVDLVTKRRQYYLAGVEYYVIVDELPLRGDDDPRRLQIIGYRRGRSSYRRLKLNDEGRLWLEPVGVWLGIEGERVVCFDRDGVRLGTYAEVNQARIAAEKRVRQLERELRLRNGGRK